MLNVQLTTNMYVSCDFNDIRWSLSQWSLNMSHVGVGW